jgi:hypothetical protein
LADSNEEVYERNEVSWWSNWAETRWFGNDGYAFFSKDFDEYFFNRAGFLKITSRTTNLIDEIEKEFDRRGLAPHMFIQSDLLKPKLIKTLADKGYRISDQMSVMELENPSFKVNSDLVLEMGISGKLEQWVDVYLKAFYGEMKFKRAVLEVMQRASKNTETSLLLASLEDKPVGCLAMFRSPGTVGVYCVGTVPESRGTHVASSMLDFAARLAANEDRKLILQTILSDSVEPLYAKLGFKRAYLKELFTRNLVHA